MSQPKQSESIFWIEVEKIRPNPFQPRKEFNNRALEDLADSIRQYGVLQPLTVTRHEEQTEAGLQVYYELIAGERRLRASKLAGLTHVPALIRTGEETNKMKLELAIIENLQREDLNPMEKAQAFKQLTEEFGLTHAAIGKRMGKSREYVSNALRLLQLPEYVQEAVGAGKITEGHARPLMMLRDQPEERDTLFKEILFKKLSVRDAEKIARSVAKDKVRKIDTTYDPKLTEYERKFSENLGTRVSIEKKTKGDGGKIVIDYFSPTDLDAILSAIRANEKKEPTAMMERYIQENHADKTPVVPEQSTTPEEPLQQPDLPVTIPTETEEEEISPVVEPPLEPAPAASLDSIFGEGSKIAFTPDEVGAKEESALSHDFEGEDEDEDDEETNAYYARLMLQANRQATRARLQQQQSTQNETRETTPPPSQNDSYDQVFGEIPTKRSAISQDQESSETTNQELGDTLSALDIITSHDIQEEI